MGVYLALFGVTISVLGLGLLANRYRWVRALFFLNTKNTKIGSVKTRESCFRSALNFLLFSIPPGLLFSYSVSVLAGKPQQNESASMFLFFMGFMLFAVFLIGAVLMFLIGLYKPSTAKTRKIRRSQKNI